MKQIVTRPNATIVMMLLVTAVLPLSNSSLMSDMLSVLLVGHNLTNDGPVSYTVCGWLVGWLVGWLAFLQCWQIFCNL